MSVVQVISVTEFFFYVLQKLKALFVILHLLDKMNIKINCHSVNLYSGNAVIMLQRPWYIKSQSLRYISCFITVSYNTYEKRVMTWSWGKVLLSGRYRLSRSGTDSVIDVWRELHHECSLFVCILWEKHLCKYSFDEY